MPQQENSYKKARMKLNVSQIDIKGSNLYSYYVKNHNAIKVGYGDSSVKRMIDYQKQYNLDADIDSLRTWKIEVASVAQTIESECHKVLLEAGLERIPLTVDGQEAQELFKLSDTSYNEAVLLVAGTIDSTIQKIVYKLSGDLNNQKEKLRRKDEENRIRKEAILARKKEEFEQKTEECAAYINQIWDLKFQPLVDLYDNTRKISINFERRPKEAALKKLFFGVTEVNVPQKLINWQSYPLIRNSIENIFNASRVAKDEYIEIHKRFNIKTIQAAQEKLNVSISNLDLNFVEYYKDDWFTVEIRLILQSVFSCISGDEAIELINLDRNLSKIVQLAKKVKPPELSNNY
jgi:hypothetical protein